MGAPCDAQRCDSVEPDRGPPPGRAEDATEGVRFEQLRRWRAGSPARGPNARPPAGATRPARLRRARPSGLPGRERVGERADSRGERFRVRPNAAAASPRQRRRRGVAGMQVAYGHCRPAQRSRAGESSRIPQAVEAASRRGEVGVVAAYERARSPSRFVAARIANWRRRVRPKSRSKYCGGRLGQATHVAAAAGASPAEARTPPARLGERDGARRCASKLGLVTALSGRRGTQRASSSAACRPSLASRRRATSSSSSSSRRSVALPMSRPRKANVSEVGLPHAVGTSSPLRTSRTPRCMGERGREEQLRASAGPGGGRRRRSSIRSRSLVA